METKVEANESKKSSEGTAQTAETSTSNCSADLQSRDAGAVLDLGQQSGSHTDKSEVVGAKPKPLQELKASSESGAPPVQSQALPSLPSIPIPSSAPAPAKVKVKVNNGSVPEAVSVSKFLSNKLPNASADSSSTAAQSIPVPANNTNTNTNNSKRPLSTDTHTDACSMPPLKQSKVNSSSSISTPTTTTSASSLVKATTIPVANVANTTNAPVPVSVSAPVPVLSQQPFQPKTNLVNINPPKIEKVPSVSVAPTDIANSNRVSLSAMSAGKTEVLSSGTKSSSNNVPKPNVNMYTNTNTISIHKKIPITNGTASMNQSVNSVARNSSNGDVEINAGPVPSSNAASSGIPSLNYVSFGGGGIPGHIADPTVVKAVHNIIAMLQTCKFQHKNTSIHILLCKLNDEWMTHSLFTPQHIQIPNTHTDGPLTHDQLEYNLPPMYPSDKLQQILDILLVTRVINIIEDEPHDVSQGDNNVNIENKNIKMDDTGASSERKKVDDTICTDEVKSGSTENQVPESNSANLNDASNPPTKTEEKTSDGTATKSLESEPTKDVTTAISTSEPVSSSSSLKGTVVTTESMPLQTQTQSQLKQQVPKKPPRYVFLNGETRSRGDTIFLPELLPALDSARLEIMETKARIEILRKELEVKPYNIEDFVKSYPHPIRDIGAIGLDGDKNKNSDKTKETTNNRKRTGREILLSMMDKYPSILEDQVYATAFKNFNC